VKGKAAGPRAAPQPVGVAKRAMAYRAKVPLQGGGLLGLKGRGYWVIFFLLMVNDHTGDRRGRAGPSVRSVRRVKRLLPVLQQDVSDSTDKSDSSDSDEDDETSGSSDSDDDDVSLSLKKGRRVD